MTEREALKLALEALELHGKQYPHMVKGYCLDAITAIKEALAEQDSKDKEQAKTDSFVRQLDEALMSGTDGAQPEQKQCDNCGEFGECCQAQPAVTESHKQEPAVWMYQNKSTHEVRFQKHMRSFVDHGAWYEVPLYSEPLANQEKTSGSPIKQVFAQRKPLSDEEIILIVAECASSHQHTDIHFARAIEAAHGIKGEA